MSRFNLITIAALIGFAWATPTAAETATVETEYGHWLAERAAQSDVVVVAQLERTDYEYRRGFPVDGRTWFRVLFDYKTPREMERLIVLETGLNPEGCYFPDLPLFDEQPRYLLFLAYDEEGALRGHVDGCAVELAVNEQGRYAAIWPQTAFRRQILESTEADTDANPPGLDSVLESRTVDMEFQGPLSRIDGSQMIAHQRRQMAEEEDLRIEGTDLIRTRGIELSDLRQLMQPGLVNQDGQLTNDQSDRVEALRRILQQPSDPAQSDPNVPENPS